MKNKTLKMKLTYTAIIFVVLVVTIGGILGIINSNASYTPSARTVALEASSTSQINNLSKSDLDYIFDLGRDYMQGNLDATEIEVEEFLRAEMLKLNAERPVNKVGYGDLKQAEKALCLKHPLEALKVNDCANASTAKAGEYYEAETLYFGNGDAFMHGYWNALMTQAIGASLAEQFATAHESETPNGLDKSMDLTNNSYGRWDGQDFAHLSGEALAEKIRDQVALGQYVRILNRAIVPTDGTGLK